MRSFPLSISLMMLVCYSLPVLADYDPVLEAQEEAQRRAAAAESARRNAEAQRMKAEAMAKARRQFVGKDAEGKTDAEVAVLYDKKMADQQRAQIDAAANAQKMYAEGMKKVEEGRPKTDAAMKQMFGKTTEDLMKMSDEEMEAFTKQLEKQYGGMEE